MGFEEEEPTSPLHPYCDDDENKLARRPREASVEYQDVSQDTTRAQEEEEDDSQDGDDDSGKVIIFDDDDYDDDDEYFDLDMFAQRRATLALVLDDDDDDDDDEHFDVDMAAQRRTSLARAILLENRLGNSRRSIAREVAMEKNTSLGERKVGSVRATSRVMDTVRKTALGASAAPKKERNCSKEEPSNSAKITKSQIHSTIEDILKMRMPSPPREEARFSAAITSIGRRMGILGESKNGALAAPVKSMLEPLTIDTNDSTVRVATPADDVDIACLRLSVFSDISPDLQSQFCARSSQAIASRRLRGATCVVVTAPRNAYGARSSILLGSAECSFHEFFSTQLGRRRRQQAILYVTEVAVNPAARRRGIGFRLLVSIEELARGRETETLYLHVDVTNREAISLYEKAGYRQPASDDPMYMEFTASLNLHPGATKGRVHHLFYKDLIAEPTWLPDVNHNDHSTTITSVQNEKMVGNLGFVIPAS
jgi:ribosomal protein S18 acetylase RimI-like enzyme